MGLENISVGRVDDAEPESFEVQVEADYEFYRPR
jgi:hypothetical protein